MVEHGDMSLPRGAGVGRFLEQMRGETREQVSVAAAAPEGVPYGDRWAGRCADGRQVRCAIL
jgi:hypothetical protein